MEIEQTIRAANPSQKIAQRLLLQVMLDTAVNDREEQADRILHDLARRLDSAGYEGFGQAFTQAMRIERYEEQQGDRQALEAWRRNHW